MQEQDMGKRAMVSAWISLISNILLTGIKIIAGLMFNSKVLVADGVHNAGDVIASATALGAMRISSQPPDEDHPYGHGKAEVIGASVVAVILFGAGIFIGYHSIAALFEPMPQEHILALVAAIISLLWKQWLYIYTIRIGRAANSQGLIATGKDHLADVYASGAAVLGIGLGLIGEHWDIPILSYGDPIAGFVVALLVLKLAWEMGRESIDVLMEKAIATEEIESYAAAALSVAEVQRIDRIRAREHGHYIIVDIRASVDAFLTIQQGHDIIRLIKRAVMQREPRVYEVLVHLNPWYADDLHAVKSTQKEPEDKV
ncbi:cation diffusion facilitator family transporter [Paenibacillus sp. M-152]|uniref:cation diffusion facilitator family transporter n=1 Tax=Paenibacillus sp. M-152 TaxID=2487928 RepID=UPI000F6CD260|nr:cation diffusion facilitator family transporter [Paenibacillus sp. M-152]AZH31555.1 cation transporter [Paenibacillus sp. M-152]